VPARKRHEAVRPSFAKHQHVFQVGVRAIEILPGLRGLVFLPNLLGGTASAVKKKGT